MIFKIIFRIFKYLFYKSVNSKTDFWFLKYYFRVKYPWIQPDPKQNPTITAVDFSQKLIWTARCFNIKTRKIIILLISAAAVYLVSRTLLSPLSFSLKTLAFFGCFLSISSPESLVSFLKCYTWWFFSLILSKNGGVASVWNIKASISVKNRTSK